MEKPFSPVIHTGFVPSFFSSFFFFFASKSWNWRTIFSLTKLLVLSSENSVFSFYPPSFGLQVVVFVLFFRLPFCRLCVYHYYEKCTNFQDFHRKYHLTQTFQAEKKKRALQLSQIFRDFMNPVTPLSLLPPPPPPPPFFNYFFAI